MSDRLQRRKRDATNTPADSPKPPPFSCEDSRWPWLCAITRHFLSWLEVYFWMPLSLFAIVGASRFAFFLSGRRPVESTDWIPEFSFRLVACILVIVLISISRQQTSFWLTKEETLDHPEGAAIQAATKCFFAGLFAYILLH